MRHIRVWTAGATLALTSVAAPGAAQHSAPRDTGLIVSTLSQAVTRPLPEVNRLSLLVDLSERALYVMDGERVVRQYPVSIGTEGYPTPRGQFRVSRLIWNPAWVPPASPWARHRRPEGPGSPSNPMGRVKIFFREPDFYIHGTGHASSLGRPASHGCIRLRNVDAAEVARLLMENGGASRDASWYLDTVEKATTSRQVRLQRPVSLVVRA